MKTIRVCNKNGLIIFMQPIKNINILSPIYVYIESLFVYVSLSTLNINLMYYLVPDPLTTVLLHK